MALLDIIFLIIFVGAIFWGYRQGFFAQLGSVGGILLGIVACRIFGPSLAHVLTPATANENDIYVGSILACVLIFIVVYLCARVIFHFIKGVTHALKLSAVERLGGVVFAIFEWFFLASLALNLWQICKPDVDVSNYSRLDNGRVLRVVRDFAPNVLGSDTARHIFDEIKG